VTGLEKLVIHVAGELWRTVDDIAQRSGIKLQVLQPFMKDYADELCDPSKRGKQWACEIHRIVVMHNPRLRRGHVTSRHIA
jgi:hypothetical protein